MTDRLSPSAASTVRVWDPLIRLFHWSLVASVSVCLVLEAGTKIHRYAGYVACGLIVFRLVWGIVGSHHARFASFITGPGPVVRYLRSLTSGSPEHHHGHNPAGAAMIVLLLLALILSAGSGALLATDAYWGDDMVEGFHELVSESLYLLLPIHLLGVVVSSVLHKENLVRAMITGDKKA
jgi:cytochrome b